MRCRASSGIVAHDVTKMRTKTWQYNYRYSFLALESSVCSKDAALNQLGQLSEVEQESNTESEQENNTDSHQHTEQG